MAKKPKIRQKLSKYNQQSRNGCAIKYIVIHYVGAISSAKNNCIYFAGGNRRASAHFFVDSEIWQSIPLNKAAWHCGGGLQDTGARFIDGNVGASLHGKCINNNSIGIELCCTKDKHGRIVPSETAIKTAIPLVQWLMEKYDIPASRVVRHFDVTGKHCPNGYTSKKAWAGLHERLTGKKKSTAKKAEKESKTLAKEETFIVVPSVGLRVRKSNTTKSDVIKVLPKGTKVTGSKKTGNWVYIPKYKGWMCMKDKNNTYLKKI